jgi:hypothetical protein
MMQRKKVPTGLVGGGTYVAPNIKKEEDVGLIDTLPKLDNEQPYGNDSNDIIESESLFTTPFWTVKSEPPDDAYEWALDYKKRNPEGAKISNIGGYQSIDQTHFDNCPYGNYLIQKLSFLPKFIVTNWWLNVNEKYDYNTAHTHPHTDLACVWYITDHNKIHFINENQHTRWNLHEGFKQFGWKHGYEGLMDVNKQTRVGDLIVFPSDVMHTVIPTLEDTPRITLSFNLIMVR